MASDCYACRLTSGDEHPPGGRIYATHHWVVEHCTGSLGTGALIVTPFRHCVHLWDLVPAESAELGPLLQLVSSVIRELTDADQVYACLWSHAEWVPVHIHFVLQPSWSRLRQQFPFPGPTIQAAMFMSGEPLDSAGVESFCRKAAALLRARGAARVG
jgi:diadenosine tetraphosphate (Ap4A) HIT family hydrolase